MILLLDHDYDGIRELDSKIPPWFLWLFYHHNIFRCGLYVGLSCFKFQPVAG